MRSVSKRVFQSREFRGAFRLAKEFREKTPTRVRRVSINVPKTLMVMGHVEFIGYRTTHGNELVLYKHDFAPGSRPQLAAGPKRNQLFLIGGRYRVTDRGIVDLDARAREIDEPQHGADLEDERELNSQPAKVRLVFKFKHKDFEEFSTHKNRVLAEKRLRRIENISKPGALEWARIEPLQEGAQVE